MEYNQPQADCCCELVLKYIKKRIKQAHTAVKRELSVPLFHCILLITRYTSVFIWGFCQSDRKPWFVSDSLQPAACSANTGAYHWWRICTLQSTVGETLHMHTQRKPKLPSVYFTLQRHRIEQQKSVLVCCRLKKKGRNTEIETDSVIKRFLDVL